MTSILKWGGKHSCIAWGWFFCVDIVLRILWHWYKSFFHSIISFLYKYCEQQLWILLFLHNSEKTHLVCKHTWKPLPKDFKLRVSCIKVKIDRNKWCFHFFFLKENIGCCQPKNSFQGERFKYATLYILAVPGSCFSYLQNGAEREHLKFCLEHYNPYQIPGTNEIQDLSQLRVSIGCLWIGCNFYLSSMNYHFVRSL